MGRGKTLRCQLKERGINTAFELKLADPEKIRGYLNVFKENGSGTERHKIPCRWKRPNAITSRSLIRAPLAKLSAAEKRSGTRSFFSQRGQWKDALNGLATRSVSVFLQTDRHRPDPYYYSNACSYRSIYHSDVTSEIYRWVASCFEQAYRPGLKYRRAGIVLHELAPAKTISIRLYDQADFERWSRLNRSIDELNLRYGRDVIRPAILHDKGGWQSQSTHRSNDANHNVERERLGLGKTFSRSVRFL